MNLNARDPAARLAVEDVQPHENGEKRTKQPYGQRDILRRVDFLNTKIDLASFDLVCRFLDCRVLDRRPSYMVSMNVNAIAEIEKDFEFKRSFESADLILMDSVPLTRLASRMGVMIPEKLSGSDLMPRICEYASRKGYRCFILGGKEGIPQRAAENLTNQYPGLEIAGTLSPVYGFENDPLALNEVIMEVKAARPDILFCCLGMPKSERLLYENIKALDVPLSFSVGAAVDFAAGNVRRAPKWVQSVGLEWLYRFFREPRRLFKRYFVDSWVVVGVLRKSRIKQ